MHELSDDELLAELGVELEIPKAKTYTIREERIISGFEDIIHFYEENGHPPLHGENNDIFERLYAVRLDRLRKLDEAKELLKDFDKYNLLSDDSKISYKNLDEIDDDELLKELGEAVNPIDDISILRNVSPTQERKLRDEVAQHEICQDFDKYSNLFKEIEKDLKLNFKETRRFKNDASITKDDFFILNGQIVYVAKVGETFRNANGKNDARLLVIYSNGTQSNILKQSLERALQKDDTGRRITNSDYGPLFSSEATSDDYESGNVYVLRSKSELPFIKEHKNIIHKIGITSGVIENRISGAENDATYLLADVEIVATYKLYNINLKKFESLVQKVFGKAKLDIEINDRFGKPVRPQEWFLVPLNIIDEAIDKIKDGSITNLIYDPNSAKLIKI